ncbi:MAG: RagB/SusD family nutrient uptake outer membrane protein [Bacteroidales bacterium]|nr:RagB/SusD family nutrient uptake outer membrane protein [Bacteroidales bacterium]
MKKIFIIFIIVAITACDPLDLLEIPNPNTYTTQDFWQSEEDIELGLVAVYNMFYKQGTWTRNIYTQMDGNADDGTSKAGWTELQEWAKFIYTNYDFFEVGIKIWSEHYKAIFRANQVLDHIDDIEFEDEDYKESIKGQLYFLRAFYYFYLEILWEDVPIVLHTSSADDVPQQMPADSVWAQIESDLILAVDRLPDQWNPEDLGRPTKGGALALLGKAYMQQHKWQEAKDALYWLVEGEGNVYYGLVDDYEENFTSLNEHNEESVFEIQFSQVNPTGFDVDFDPNSQLGTQIAINSSPKGLGWNNIQANRWLVDYYKREKTIDGKNDYRLFINFWYNDRQADFPDQTDFLIYGRTWTSDPTWSRQVFIRKYMTTTLEGTEAEFYWNDINFRLIRYSDVLLLYAEVLNELNGGPTPYAIECVNRVRTRANLPLLQNSTYYTDPAILTDQTAFLKHLQTERALELPCECVRWIDLKRWGLLMTQEGLDELTERDKDFKSFELGKSHRLPIPQSEVDNNPNLNQNEPY